MKRPEGWNFKFGGEVIEYPFEVTPAEGIEARRTISTFPFDIAYAVSRSSLRAASATASRSTNLFSSMALTLPSLRVAA
jgi:hypothetical protein